MPRILSRSFWNPDIAVDLGTAVTRVTHGEGAPLEHLSIAGDKPALRSGVVADPDATVAVLQPLIRAAKKLGIMRPRALACVPTDANDQERGAVIDCLFRAGVSAVIVVPEPLAAAVGAGVDVSSPCAHMIIDIGEGVTDCAIIKEGAVVASRAVRIGCGELRDALRKGIMERWCIQITQDEAEYGLRTLGISSRNEGDEHDNPITKWLPATSVYCAMEPVVKTMLCGITSLLRDIQSKLYCDIIDNGLLLSGGGSLLRGMRERIAAETRLNVSLAVDPLGAVVTGAQAMLSVAATLKLWHQP